MNLSEIPEDQKAAPWLQSFIHLFPEQARIIQTLSEENATLKITTIQELRDELVLNFLDDSVYFLPKNLQISI